MWNSALWFLFRYSYFVVTSTEKILYWHYVNYSFKIKGMVDLQCIFDRSLVLRCECKSSLGIFCGWMTKLQNTVTHIMLYSNVEFSVCIINKELTRVVMQWFDLFCIELNFVRIHNFWRPQFRLSKTIPNRMISFDPTSERPAGHASRKCHFGRDKNWIIAQLGSMKTFPVWET